MTTKKHSITKSEAEVPERVDPAAELPVYTPATDILAGPDAIVVAVDMPGVDPAKVEVELEDDVLTITGTAEDPEPSGLNVLYRDYEPGRFQRSFTLSAKIDRSGIQAHSKNGVLQLTLPKSKEAQPRQIPVKLEA